MAREVKLHPFDIFTGIGIGVMMDFSTPPGKVFSTSYTTIDQAKTNFLSLLLTSEGERPMQPEFGCNLRKMVFEPMDGSLISKIENLIRSKTNFWLPYIQILKMDILPEADLNTISFDITIALKDNRFDTANVTFILKA